LGGRCRGVDARFEPADSMVVASAPWSTFDAGTQRPRHQSGPLAQHREDIPASITDAFKELLADTRAAAAAGCSPFTFSDEGAA
jgi:hypothetical protein